MAGPQVLIFHRPPASGGDAPLVRLLARVRQRMAEHHTRRFRAAGAQVRLVSQWPKGMAFGTVLAQLAPRRGGLVALSSGAVPLLRARDVDRLLGIAGGGQPVALTNNRYSSDVCAVGQGAVLRRLPPLATDNGLPRWLEEEAGFKVSELPARERLALDLDTPLDAALLGLHPACPAWLRELVGKERLGVPRLDELRGLVADSRRELLVQGRGNSATLRWLERNVPCRVRFLVEERGLRTSAPAQRHPRATLGRLLERDGPNALAALVAELSDGAILDSRVLLADRLGRDEQQWPAPADRYASDLLRTDEVRDPWLRALTASAANSSLPILLGGHSLVGAGLPLVLGRARN
jgi:CTP:molybdopterin cytidylyltransferase MocA